MSIHPDHKEACEILDAMMFSGCPSEDELAMLEKYIERWNREIPKAREFNRNL